jgi:hypothetical protein
MPAKPTNVITNSLSTVTAVVREASYLQITPVRGSFGIKVPPFGTITIIVSYLAFILTLEFINNDVPGAQHYQSLGVRAGWLAAGHVPLIILLSGKNNLIGLLCGVSYERLLVYHRWVARGMLLLATLHFSFQSHGWNLYGLMQLEWATDTCPPTGMAAYAILLWMNLITLAPFRSMAYEFFIIQHLITYFGFIIALSIHLWGTTSPWSAIWVFVGVGIYLLLRLARTARYVVNNVRPARATLEALEGGVATKVRVSSRQIKKWAPGSHVLLSIPKFGLIQSHPATIMSTPASHDGDLVFILRAFKGFTGRILKAAAPSTSSSVDFIAKDNSAAVQTFLALIDGPYGASHSDFACFDALVLIAGGTGVTFTLSNLLDIAHRATSQKLPLREVHFIWLIKKKALLSWAAEQLRFAFETLQGAGIETKITICVTCDDTIVEDAVDAQEAIGCHGRNNKDPCDDISPVDKKGEKSLSKGAVTNPVLTCAALQSGRPCFEDLLRDVVCQAEGETAVAVCGPLGLSVSVRSAVVKISDELAVHKGTGAQGVYLHVESFSS